MNLQLPHWLYAGPSLLNCFSLCWHFSCLVDQSAGSCGVSSDSTKAAAAPCGHSCLMATWKRAKGSTESKIAFLVCPGEHSTRSLLPLVGL